MENSAVSYAKQAKPEFSNEQNSQARTEGQRYHSYGHFVQPVKPEVREGKYSIPMSETRPRQELEVSIQTVQIMVRSIRAVFGLTAAQVAEVVGVSRPSLYNHLSEKETPKDLGAYYRVFSLAKAVEKSITPNLQNGLKSVLVNGRSLLSYLKDRNVEVSEFINVAKAVASAIADRPEELSVELESSKLRLISSSLSKHG